MFLYYFRCRYCQRFGAKNERTIKMYRFYIFVNSRLTRKCSCATNSTMKNCHRYIQPLKLVIFVLKAFLKPFLSNNICFHRCHRIECPTQCTQHTMALNSSALQFKDITVLKTIEAELCTTRKLFVMWQNIHLCGFYRFLFVFDSFAICSETFIRFNKNIRIQYLKAWRSKRFCYFFIFNILRQQQYDLTLLS